MIKMKPWGDNGNESSKESDRDEQTTNSHLKTQNTLRHDGLEPTPTQNHHYMGKLMCTRSTRRTKK